MQTEPKIVVYANRKQTIWRTLLLDGLTIFLYVLCLFAITSLTIMVAQAHRTANDLIIIIAICAIPFLLMLTILVLVGMASWNMTTQFLFTRKPYLVVTQEGMTVGKQVLLRRFSLFWDEIEQLVEGFTCTGAQLTACLNISLKSRKSFITHFSAFERSNMRLSFKQANVIIIPQMYLEMPIAQILVHIHQQFAQECKQHGIEVEWLSLPVAPAGTRDATRKSSLKERLQEATKRGWATYHETKKSLKRQEPVNERKHHDLE